MYNILATEEIITCDTTSYLKKVIKINREWDCHSNKWVFSHNGEVSQKKW